MRPTTPLHRPHPHESARLHVTGGALYVDELPEARNARIGLIVPAGVAHGRVVRIERSRAESAPGIDAVLLASDIPGEALIGPIAHDEPVLAGDEVRYAGQPIALIVGESLEACRDAAGLMRFEIEELPATLSIAAAIAEESFFGDPHIIRRGDVEAALESAQTRVEGELSTPAQDHFYLETQAALALPLEAGGWQIFSSSQNPTEVQQLVARTLGVGRHRVVCDVPRMGGAFGGKESQGALFACLAAIGAARIGRPVKLRLTRREDMAMTGPRHPFWSTYEAGFDRDGLIQAFKVATYADGGFSLDLSPAILSRALFHLDNSYYIPTLRFEGRICRTHKPSTTAFRGFGGPQGMAVIEDAINRFAERTGRDPTSVRVRNFYGEAPRDRAPYHQRIPEPRLSRIHSELSADAEVESRASEIAVFNAGSLHVKRALAFQPVKFGIAFTNRILNQAGALVHVYRDGTVQVNHGGTEMGQGLHTKMQVVCADELGIPLDNVRVMRTSTGKVPNTTPTAASSGSDLNGQAIADACAKLRARLGPVAAGMMGRACDEDLCFEGDRIATTDAERSVPFHEVAMQAWLERVSLSATGYYATPGISYDIEAGRGCPFFYFAYGGAFVEVALDGRTGRHRLLRVDILHDVGNSLVPSIDRGQIEGGFLQGVGWLTCEERIESPDGRVVTLGPSTYKIPAAGDAPRELRIRLLDRAGESRTIGGSKAVGEPPFMLALGVVTALRQAVAAFDGRTASEVELRLPATPESLLRAIETRAG
ncbi:MAG: xanthine dehydrogenase molybdopterin binding subunit [Gemmatimonadetes bacterium]|nr:xanthine dehydrogenase molybdopterin binding subunit [Gemmatimonadota bacterium]